MFFGKLHQFGHTRHRAVVVQNLANYTGGYQAAHPGQIHRRLGVSGAHQHAAFLRTQRENMSGLDDIFRPHFGRNGRLNGMRAIGGGNTRADALRGFDGNGEIGAVLRAVFLRHLRQAQAVHQFVVHRQANQPARVFNHKVNRLRGNELCGHHQIAFVFAVFGVGDDDHFAGLDIGQDFGNGGNGCHGVFTFL